MPVNFQMIIRSKVEMWNQKNKPKHIYTKSDPFVVHNHQSHLNACIWLISNESRYPAIHLLPTSNTDCLSMISKKEMGTQWMRRHGPELADVEFGQDMTKK